MSTYQDIAYAVLDTQTWSVEQLRAFADRVIEAAPRPAVWLNGVALASSLDEARQSLERGTEERSLMLSTGDVMTLSIGLLHLQLEQGTLARTELIQRVGELLDTHDHSEPDVEGWYEDTKRVELPATLRAFVDACTQQARTALARLDDIERVIREPLFRE
jgi:hypothetical protein